MKYSLSEYVHYISLKIISSFIRSLPLTLALFLGRTAGRLRYYLDSKHRRVAYRNLRIALSETYSIPQLKLILKKNYQNLGMNMVEILRLPKMNQDYLDRYIKISGRKNLDKALNDKKGAIILSSHFGNWEICFGIGGILGYPFYILAQEQARNPLLNIFLNQIRQSHHIGVLRGNHLMRDAIRILQEKKIVVMVADHGMKEGVLVDFFGRKVRTPTMSIRIALNSDVPILITYIRRIKGPRHELMVMPPLKVIKTKNPQEDINTNSETINRITQDYIAKNPEQYLWFYKRFKYSNQRNILLLHDGKAGHLRQIQAISEIISDEAKKRGLNIRIKEVNIEFKSKLHSISQTISLTLAARGQCQGCLWCLKHFLGKKIFRELQSYFADIVVSCGSKIAAVNFVISSENQAKSIVLMRPGTLHTKRFDLVIMPAHDNPPQGPNIIKTDGALNLIDKDYIESQAQRLRPAVKITKELVIGLLLGGDTRHFKLTVNLLKPLFDQIKLFLQKHDGQILITTSRRSSGQIEDLVKQEFGDYDRCKLLIIAKEKNIPEAVGGILGLSKIVITSPESISMISEAASSGKYVVVFRPQTNIGYRHNRFLKLFSQKQYIYLIDSSELSQTLERIIIQCPEVAKLQDRVLLTQAIGRLL